jgi:hypothetical protein
MSGTHSISIPIKYISTDNSTSTSTGSIIISGGISVLKNIRTSEGLIIHNNENDAQKSILTTNSNGSLLLNGSPISGTFDPNAVLNLTNTTNSDSITSGALTTLGGVGISKDLYIGGFININDTNNSTSTTTGALRVSGGVGVAKDLYVEGGLGVSGASAIYSTLAVRGLYNYNSTGTIRTVMTTDVNGDLTIDADGNDINFHSTDAVRVNNDTNATSSVSGALIVNGGVGVVKEITVGSWVNHENGSGDAYYLNKIGTADSKGYVSRYDSVTNSYKLYELGGTTNPYMLISLTTASTSTNTGALVVSGGVGIAKDLYVGGSETITNNETISTNVLTILQPSLEAGNGSFIKLGTALSANNVSNIYYSNSGSNPILHLGIDGGSYLDIKPSSVVINATTASTSTNTGALVVSGGVSIAKDLYVGGAINYPTNTGAIFYKVYDHSNLPSDVTKILPTDFNGSLLISGIRNSTNYSTPFVAVESYALKYIGYIKPLYSETYNFYMESDDAAILYINHQFICSARAAVPGNGTITLVANQWYPFYLEHVEVGGSQYISLLWSSTSQAQQGIPSSSLGYNQWETAPSNLGTTTVDGFITITNTTLSASTSSGALIVKGGVGISKNLYVGSDLNIAGTSTLNGASVLNGSLTMGTNDIVSVGTITSSENIITTLTETSSSTTTGALRIAGGAGLGSLYVAGSSIIDGVVTINNTTVSTSTTSGALIVAGGLGIANQIHCGNMVKLYNGAHGGEFSLDSNGIITINAGGDVITSGDVLKITNTTESVSATTGALIVDGGLGIGKDAFFNGDVTITQTLTAQSLVYEYEEIIQSTAESTDITSGAAVINGGVGIVKNANIGGVLHTYDTTQSESVTTGAVIIDGGVGIAKKLYVGGSVSIIDTTQATDSISGSLIISGGVGISKDLIVGGDISSGSVSGSKSFTGPCTLTDTLSCYKVGHIVIVKFPYNSDTVTSATYFSSSGAIASGYRPTETFRHTIFVTNNNTEIAGSITINTSGDINVYTGTSGNFTLSGTAGFSLNIFYAI